jgi:hypothetical protein
VATDVFGILGIETPYAHLTDVNIPALGTGFTGIGFRNIDHGYIFLLRLKLQKLFEPIVCPSQHRL